MKICPICKNKMVYILDKVSFPNKDIIVKRHLKCKTCGCNIFITNIPDLLKKGI